MMREVTGVPIARLNGVSLHYHVRGKGVPIIWIHPPLLTSENFNYQMAQLSDSFRLITFDIRGHGYSGTSDEPLTYRLIVEDMLALMDKLGVKQAYVGGYSTGGSIALQALLSAPERFLGGVLISAMSEASDMWLRGRIRGAAALTRLKSKSLISWAITWGNADSRLTYKNLRRAARRGNIANWRQYYQYSLTYNCTDRLQDIKAPVLLIYGQSDRSFHKYALILHKGLPNSQLYWIPKAKHQIPTKNALEMNWIIDQWVKNRCKMLPEEREEALAWSGHLYDADRDAPEEYMRH
ncbi:alpha/beta hydrolase [Paenibacillus thiaminolyticus]|uniref:alpha/beta fold hydrolase n=1 Tax=Paenibacillus thiaminolyticus TaxID=49283 RepID=UPI002350C597|nr:alpha/beta hydrolase [Paenibacillus thiaminolyticus]WCR28912.1 alpha/beta hydrolase [Paenibacillus thiaminolyticus]